MAGGNWQEFLRLQTIGWAEEKGNLKRAVLLLMKRTLKNIALSRQHAG